ncbi:Virulence protein RhuM family protein [compost metagenome]
MMTTLHDVSVPAINQHLERIFADNELDDAAVIKRYLHTAAATQRHLSEFELTQMQRIVSAYLDMAELQTMRRIPMTMQDWACGVMTITPHAAAAAAARG